MVQHIHGTPYLPRRVILMPSLNDGDREWLNEQLLLAGSRDRYIEKLTTPPPHRSIKLPPDTSGMTFTQVDNLESTEQQ